MNILKNLNNLNIVNILVLLAVFCGVIFGSSYITSLFNKTEIEYYIDEYNKFKKEVEITKEYTDSLEKIVAKNNEIIQELNDSIVITVSNLNQSNQRVEESEKRTQELSKLLTDSIIRETPVEVIDYIQSLEVENVALKESNRDYEEITRQLFGKVSILEESLMIQTERADSLNNIVIRIPDAPSNPDKILGFIPKPTRTQTYILGIGTGIIANIVISR